MLLVATKLIEKIHYATTNVKQYYQSYFKSKNTKLVKKSNIITQQPKMFENSNIVVIKSVLVKQKSEKFFGFKNNEMISCS